MMEKLMEDAHNSSENGCSTRDIILLPNLPPPAPSLTKETTPRKKNLDCLPQAIHAARYQDVNVSTGSYLKQSHRGARRQGHKGSKAQSVSDNGGEGAWPASSRVRLRVGDKETERRRSFAGEGRRHVRASSHSAWREHVRFPATIRSITITIYYLRS